MSYLKNNKKEEIMNTKKSFDEKELDIIHSRFRQLREKTETNYTPAISQRKLSKLINVTYSRICKLESNDDTEPSLHELTAYSRYFNVSIDYLLGLSSESTLNVKTKEISKEIGISVDSIEAIKQLKNSEKKVLNDILENSFLDTLLSCFGDYLKYNPMSAENPNKIIWTDLERKVSLYLTTDKIDNLLCNEILETLKKVKKSNKSYKNFLIKKRRLLKKNLKKYQLKIKARENRMKKAGNIGHY